MLTAVVGKLDELDEGIVQDQRMVRAFEKWAACMRERGYRYDDPDAIDTDLLDRFQSIMGVGRQAWSNVTRRAPAPATTAPRSPPSSSRRSRSRPRTSNASSARFTPVEDVVRPQHERAFRTAEPRAAGAGPPAS